MNVTLGICVVSGIMAAAAPISVQAQEPPPAPPAADLRQAAEQSRDLAQLAALGALKDLEGLTRLALEDGQLQQGLQQVQQALQQQAQRLRQAAPAAAAAKKPHVAKTHDRGPEVTENYTKTIRLGRGGTFDLTKIAGEVVITGGVGDDVRIDAVKRVAQWQRDRRRGQARLIKIQVDERNRLVEVRTVLPRRRNSAGVDFTVALPPGRTWP